MATCTTAATAAEIALAPSVESTLAAAGFAEPRPDSTSPDRAVTANGIAPGNPPRPVSCYKVGIGITYEDRYDACGHFYIIARIINTANGQVVGTAAYHIVEWQVLNQLSRVWDHHLVTNMYYSDGVARNGMWTYLFSNCLEPCVVESSTPPDAWVFVVPNQTYHGVTTMASHGTQTDYFITGAGIAAFAPGSAPASANPEFFVEVRCDSVAYIPGSGCTYWSRPALLTLSASDRSITKAAEFYRDAQAFLAGPTGVVGSGRPLHRATTFQDYLNRQASGPVCASLPVDKSIPESCDEFPFASATEGAASGPLDVNWAVRAVPATQNSRVGQVYLSGLYGSQRLFYLDEFYLQILP
jgi:hypothetical protein